MRFVYTLLALITLGFCTITLSIGGGPSFPPPTLTEIVITPTGADPTPTREAAYITATNYTVNIRQTPSRSARIIGQAKPSDSIRINIDASVCIAGETWASVTVNNTSGFILAGLLLTPINLCL